MRLQLAVSHSALDINDIGSVLQQILGVIKNGPRPLMTDFEPYRGRPSILRHHRHCRLTRARVRDLYEVPIPAPWEG